MFFGCSPCCGDKFCSCKNTTYSPFSNLFLSPNTSTLGNLIPVGNSPFCSLNDIESIVPTDPALFVFRQQTTRDGWTEYRWENGNDYIVYNGFCDHHLGMGGYWRFTLNFSSASPSCMQPFQETDYSGFVLKFEPREIWITFADLNCQQNPQRNAEKLCELLKTGETVLNFCSNHSQITEVYDLIADQQGNPGENWLVAFFAGSITISASSLP